MTIADSKWVYKNKAGHFFPQTNIWHSSLSNDQEQGMMSTVGSLGALLLWGIDEGLTQIDKCA